MSRAAPRIPRSVPKGKRRPDPRRASQHLAFVRELEICLACGKRGCVVPMHVRALLGPDGQRGGMGMKSGDRHTVPGCQTPCHERQHKIGEVSFWSERGVDAVSIAAALWAVSGNLEAGRRIVERSLLTRHVFAMEKP